MNPLPRLLAVVLTLGLATPALAAEENAADLYREAFEQMKLTEAEYDRLREAVKAVKAVKADEPLPADVKRTLQENAPVVELALKAAEAETVDWGFKAEQGLEAEMPWLGRTRQLALLTAASVRLAAEAGNGGQAADLIAANLTLGHNVGRSPQLLLPLLVECEIDSLTADMGAIALGQMNGDVLRRLRDRLDEREPLPPFSSVVEAESEFAARWVLNTPEYPAEFLSYDENLPIDRAIRESWPSENWRQEQARQIRRVGEAVKRIVEMPPGGERNAAFERLEESLVNEVAFGVLPAILTPTYERALAALERASVKLALLRAAIAYRLDGEAGLKTIPDPAGEGPFRLEETPEGFTLTSAKVVDGEPMSLAVRVSE